MLASLFLFLLAVGGFCILLAAFRSGHPFRAILATALQGTCAFFAVYALGALCGVHVPLNGFTAAISLLGGTPGVIFLLLMQTMYGGA